MHHFVYLLFVSTKVFDMSSFSISFQVLVCFNALSGYTILRLFMRCFSVCNILAIHTLPQEYSIIFYATFISIVFISFLIISFCVRIILFVLLKDSLQLFIKLVLCHLVKIIYFKNYVFLECSTYFLYVINSIFLLLSSSESFFIDLINDRLFFCVSDICCIIGIIIGITQQLSFLFERFCH